jgi:hypothetical protein
VNEKANSLDRTDQLIDTTSVLHIVQPVPTVHTQTSDS